MQTRQHFIEAELQTTTNGFGAVREPFAQHHLQVFHLWTTIQTNHVHINAEVLFQIGGGKQVRHHRIGVHPVRLRHDDQTGGVFVVGFIAQVGDQRQFFRLHLSGNLLQNFGTGHLMRQCGNDDIAIFNGIDRAHFHTATAITVDFAQVVARRDDFCLSREIGRGYVLAQGFDAGLRIIQQMNTGAGDFADIVRRNIRCHTHGNTGGAIKQNIRQTRRQSAGLVHGAVKVRLPLHRALTQLAE